MIAFSALILIAGCQDEGSRRPNDFTQSNINRETRIVKNDPATRAMVMNDCRANVRRGSAKDRQNIAVFMKVPVSEAAETFCSRIVGGLESGRLTAADGNALKRGRITPAALAVLQGE
ncbi:hypothetical protein ACHFJ0_10085 [Paracoccus sp. NGMCC 1.201697]|uniref:Lipoprotein n=1 Tax=Paracoccus broussonetiae subsp. drimophilus TaxID=3373869 RepID=A0ABW7LK63_9RHOB